MLTESHAFKMTFCRLSTLDSVCNTRFIYKVFLAFIQKSTLYKMTSGKKKERHAKKWSLSRLEMHTFQPKIDFFKKVYTWMSYFHLSAFSFLPSPSFLLCASLCLTTSHSLYFFPLLSPPYSLSLHSLPPLSPSTLPACFEKKNVYF